MKYVAVRILQQWKILKEYFLKFLPNESNFKSTVANTDCYMRICAALQDPVTEAYTSFCAYSTTKFEDILLQFHSDEPRIHLLYFSMFKHVLSLQQKFIRKKFLCGVDSETLLAGIHFKENRKVLQFVDIGTKAKSILNEQTHKLKIAQQDKLGRSRKDCLNFYLYATTHLLDRLPFYVPVLKHAQYLHPYKRNDSGATIAISNLSPCMVSVLTNKLCEVFHIQSPITFAEICDKIQTQWMRFQTEPKQDE